MKTHKPNHTAEITRLERDLQRLKDDEAKGVTYEFESGDVFTYHGAVRVINPETHVGVDLDGAFQGGIDFYSKMRTEHPLRFKYLGRLRGSDWPIPRPLLHVYGLLTEEIEHLRGLV